jgi:CpeT/CpcT family (DUF1001)
MTISLSKASANASKLITLTRWVVEDFSNQKQSDAEPQLYAHIHIFFRALGFELFSAIGFYSEQVDDYDLWTHYRQEIHRLVKHTWLSLDKGIVGSMFGPLLFEKRETFANEVPAVSKIC